MAATLRAPRASIGCVIVALADAGGLRLASRIMPGEGRFRPDFSVAGGHAERPHGLSRQDVIDLYARHYVSLCRMAELLVDDCGRAEELVQDAFTRTFAGRHAVRETSAAAGYLRRAVVHACHSELRRRRVERRLGVGVGSVSVDAAMELPGGATSIEDAYGESTAVLDALRSLTRRQREVIVLRYYLDLDEQEMALAMGCSTGTIKSQLSKARYRLAGLLDPSVGGNQ
jgi:RNA polymerase sigma factor (sigma-70 family)